jgi:hypothetical protein
MRRLFAYMALLIIPAILDAQENNPIKSGIIRPSHVPVQIADTSQVSDTGRISIPARKPDTIIAKTTRQWTLSSDYTTLLSHSSTITDSQTNTRISMHIPAITACLFTR